MNKVILMGILMAAVLWLSGCTILSFEEDGHTKQVRVACTPTQGILRVVHVPCPQPRPDPGEFFE